MHPHSFSLRSEAPGRLTKQVRQYGPLKPFGCIPTLILMKDLGVKFSFTIFVAAGHILFLTV
jgi:hypothetical protein